jgi:hypothetical protein
MDETAIDDYSSVRICLNANIPTCTFLFPCLLTDRDEMSNLHRGHSIDDSYQVSVVAMFVNRSGLNEHSS